MPDVRLLLPCLMAMTAALAVTAARAQQDLDAGKTGPQLFSQDCAACHRSAQGLAKTSGAPLVGFLRQHYTSSSASAAAVAAYLQAAGPGRAAPTKDQKGQPKDQARGQPPAQPQQAQPAPPPAPSDRGARIARPSEPIPSVAQPEPAPPAANAPPGAKKRERLARPTDPGANPQAPPVQQGRRKLRRHEAPAAAAPATPDLPAYPPPPPNLDPVGGQASPPPPAAGRTEAAGPKASGPAQPSFVEPLP